MDRGSRERNGFWGNGGQRVAVGVSTCDSQFDILYFVYVPRRMNWSWGDLLYIDGCVRFTRGRRDEGRKRDGWR